MRALHVRSPIRGYLKQPRRLRAVGTICWIQVNSCNGAMHDVALLDGLLVALPGAAKIDAGNTLNFPRSAPVFDLPAAFSVQSSDAGITDNRGLIDVPLKQESWGS